MLSPCYFLIISCRLVVTSSEILFELRVMPKESLVILRTSLTNGSISSSMLFMQKLKCLNYGFLIVTHSCTVSPSSFFFVICSILSNYGTGSSGFFEALSFLFFSTMASLFLSSARCDSTSSTGNGNLPIKPIRGLI